MKLAAAVLLLLATPALAAEIPGIEPVYGVTAARTGVTLRVASNGCTRKSDLTIAISKGQPRPILLIARKHPDACRAPGRAEITYSWDELGLKAGQAFSFANPLVAELTAEQPSGPRIAGACKRVEVDAVLPNGTGKVRVLGPQGLLDLDVPPLVSTSEVTGAEAGSEGGETIVRLVFAPAAGQRLAAWSASHVGSRMAVLLDGQVIRLGDVKGPMGALGLQLSGLDRGQALSIAAGVNACGAGSEK